MKRPQEKPCKTCGKMYIPMSWSGLHCPFCQQSVRQQSYRKHYEANRARARIKVTDDELVARMDAYLVEHAADTVRKTVSPIVGMAGI